MQGGEQVTLPMRAKGEVTKDELGHWEQVGETEDSPGRGKHRGHEVPGGRLNIRTERRRGWSGRQCPDHEGPVAS